MANLIRKQVVFNPEDPDQKQLLTYAESRTNFSAYIKRLIQRDMEGGRSFTPAPMQEGTLDFNAEGFI